MISMVCSVAIWLLSGVFLFLLGIRCGKAEEQIALLKDLPQILGNTGKEQTPKQMGLDDFQQDLQNILMYTGEKHE